MAEQIDMFAPVPFFDVYTRDGRVYKADSQGWIENINPLDVSSLRRAGCLDKDVYMTMIAELTEKHSILTEEQLEQLEQTGPENKPTRTRTTTKSEE